MQDLTDPFRLDGRVALITGGSRGIGRAIAEVWANAGCEVIMTSRDFQQAEEAAAGVRRAGGKAVAAAYDAARTDGIAALVEHVEASSGRLDILVNNAAQLIPHSIEKLTEAEFDTLFQVNVKSALFLSKAVLPLLSRSQNAAIINIAAAGAHVPMAGIGAYCATKAAILNLTRTQAKEWAGRRIRVNALTPGSVATDMILPKDPERKARFVADMASMNLMNRLGDPAEIARAAQFLASDAASFVTGQTLIVDGGLLA